MKLALLTIGNPLRGDDGIGEAVGTVVEEKLGLKVFYGGNAPENEFHRIRRFSPDLLIIVDAVIGVKEGEVGFFDISENDDVGFIYTTHNIPVSKLIYYIKSFVPKIIFLGIGIDKTKAIEISDTLSVQAKNAIPRAFKLVENIVMELKST